MDGRAVLVTGDFFAREANVDAAAKAGCIGLFSGVESFDQDQLASYNKKQNKAVPQIEMIRGCLDRGVLFQYGIMLDPSTRHIAELEREIDFILSTPEITLPAYFTLPIPLLGTPYFETCLGQGLIRPGLRLSEMNGVSLLLRPLDGVEQGVRFARDLVNLRGRRGKVLRHAAGFLARYGRRLSRLQNAVFLANAALTTLPGVATSPLRPRLRAPKQTFLGPTEPQSSAYLPPIPIDPAYRHFFEPTMVTDARGGLAADLVADLAPRRATGQLLTVA